MGDTLRRNLHRLGWRFVAGHPVDRYDSGLQQSRVLAARPALRYEEGLQELSMTL
jgi:hypothetical protein